ncbi:MucBP domain-containing protein (plasmid) [Lactococcus lactis]|uniref:MucBP domain-containing protein n=1 Tax=Lactococcus lactis TaxID=1358 RepID=UPI003313C070
MIKKSSTIIALGIILCSNALPAIAETSSVIPKETSALKTSESSDGSSSQSSTTQTTSDSTTSDSTIDNENQELQKSQEDTQKDITTTTVQNNSSKIFPNKPAGASDDIDSGMWGTVPWRIDSEGTLHLGAGVGADTGGTSPWSDYDENSPNFSLLKKIVIEGEIIAPSDSSWLFSNIDYITEIDNLNKLNTSEVTNMKAMFRGLLRVENLDVSSFKTTNVTDMSAMFSECWNVHSLDLSSFDTSKVTDMSQMFQELFSVKKLDLSSFNTTSVTNMLYMFGETRSLNELDLSSFDTSNVINMRQMFNGDGLESLQILHLGNKTSLDDTVELFSPTEAKTFDSSKFTGNWQTVGKGTNTSPEGDFIGSSADLYVNSQKGIAETYVWQPRAAEDVTVKYLDTDGNEIHKAQTISGNVGEAYDASTDAYKLAIDGYTLDTTKLPDNATGTLSDTAQTVTYVYTKNPVKAADVTVKYLDADGNEIHKAQTISGNVGEAYDASTDAYKLAIDGYTLDTTKLPDNATGTLSDTAQTVTYVYTKNPVKAADVTVKYLDADGNEIHKAQTISGNVGEAYDASTDAYKLAIDGYTLDTTKLPDNATGTLSEAAQTITYVYTKNPVKAADVTVKYLDAEGNEIHKAQTISGNVGEAYDASTDTYKLDIDGYTLDTTKLPDNATGTLSDTAQTVTYVYEKTVTPAPPVKPDSPTIPNRPIKPSPSSNTIPDVTAVTSSLPQTGDNQVISILMIFFGALLLSFSTILAFFKIKKS